MNSESFSKLPNLALICIICFTVSEKMCVLRADDDGRLRHGISSTNKVKQS